MLKRFLAPSPLLLFLSIMGITGFLGGVILERAGFFPACRLCHIERLLLLAAGGMSFLTWIWRTTSIRRCVCLITLCVWLAGSLTGFYHAAIQYNVISVPSFCKIDSGPPGTLDSELSSFMSTPSKACNQRTLDIFSFPASLYVGVFMLIAAGLCWKPYREFHDTLPPTFY